MTLRAPPPRSAGSRTSPENELSSPRLSCRGPRPTTRRPSESWSRVAVWRANTQGRRRARGVTSMPRRTRSVAWAMAAAITNESATAIGPCPPRRGPRGKSRPSRPPLPTGRGRRDVLARRTRRTAGERFHRKGPQARGPYSIRTGGVPKKNPQQVRFRETTAAGKLTRWQLPRRGRRSPGRRRSDVGDVRRRLDILLGGAGLVGLSTAFLARTGEASRRGVAGLAALRARHRPPSHRLGGQSRRPVCRRRPPAGGLG